MQTSFLRLPAAARALINAGLSSAAIFAVMSLYAVSAPWGGTYQSVTARLVVSIIAGILTGVLSVAVGDRRIRDTYGSVDQAIAYSRALRTGELPEQIEPDRWRGFLLASVKSNRWAPAAVGVFAVLAVLQSIDRQWPLVALFCAIAIGQTATALVLRRRIARLRDAIDRRSIAAG